jgi:hypothetical protein
MAPVLFMYPTTFFADISLQTGNMTYGAPCIIDECKCN